MEIITKCKKRKNEINILLHTEKKRMIESVYSTPNKTLIKRICYNGDTIEEVRTIYLEALKKHREQGYEIKDKKEGKVLFLNAKVALM